VREDIKAYIDGELSPERMQEVRTALEHDPELMQEYLAMKDITQKLQSLVRQPQVKGVEQTMQKVVPRRRFRLIEGFAVAACLLVIGAIMFPVFTKAKYAAKKSSTVAFSNPEEREASAGAQGAGRFGAEDVPTLKYESKSKELNGFRRDAGIGGDAYGVAMEDEAIGGLSAGASPERTAKQVPGVAGPRTSQVQPSDVKDAEVLLLEQRLVIKDAAMTIKVKDVEDAVSKAIQLAATYKGYIENSSVSQGTEKAPIAGNVTIRLPQQNFEKAMLELEKFGDVTDRANSGNDVTGEVTDIEARINTLRAEEESLRTLLRGATKMGDILDIKDRISQVRQQIESYDSQRRVLTRLSALSTISLRFTTDKKEAVKNEQEEIDETWFEDTKVAALGILKGVGRFLAQAATFAFILLPIWLPVLLFALWFRRRAFAPTPQG
jgi:hypothetical protein